MKTKEIRIENWASVDWAPRGAWTPPEMMQRGLAGNIYGDPDHEEGKPGTVVFRVQVIEGRTIKTKDGMTIRLGEPDPGYVKWLDENGYVYNPEYPLTIGEGTAPRKEASR